MQPVSRKKIVIIIFLFLFFTPLLLPDDFSGFEGENKEVARFAISEVETEFTPPVWKYKVVSVHKINNITTGQLPLDFGETKSAYRIVLLGYTYFHIPVLEAEVYAVTDASGFHGVSGSFKDSFNGAWDILIILMLVSYLIPFLLLAYLTKTIIKNKRGFIS